MEDYLDPRNAEGMPKQADSLFALDFLLTAKTGVITCAAALSECASPEARTILRNQLEGGISMHEQIAGLMLNKGWLHPYDVNEQFPIDLKGAQTTVQIAQLQLFPEDTSRLGMFATPNK